MTSPPDRPARIVFLDRATLSPQTRLRAPRFAHELVLHESTTPDEIAERIAGADVVITNKVPLRRDAIRGAQQLRLIAVAATGTDVVDLEACAAAGVAVSNIRDYAVHTVPEHTFALILALRRSILAYRDSVARGRWQEADQFCYFDYPVRDLAGSTLGVIGDGSIGQSVAESAQRRESPRVREHRGCHPERDHVGKRIELDPEFTRGPGHAGNPAVEHVQHHRDADERRRGGQVASHRVDDARPAAEQVGEREQAGQ
jgi:lactate dehydrogenase-like 2-hydroxyacid dehydrogenase